MEGYNSKLAMALGGGLALGLGMYLFYRNKSTPQIENIDDFEEPTKPTDSKPSDQNAQTATVDTNKSNSNTDTNKSPSNNQASSNDLNASQLKEQGNEMFKAKKFQLAIDLYTKALEVSSSDSERKVLFSNRAACFISLDSSQYFQRAFEDCEEGLKIAPTWSRLLVRSGKAAHYLKDYEESYLRLNLGKKYDPELKDDALPKLLEEASKQLPTQSDMDTRVNIERRYFEARLFREINEMCVQLFGITHDSLCDQLKKESGLEQFSTSSKAQDIEDFLSKNEKFSSAFNKNKSFFIIACWWGALKNRDADGIQCLRALSSIIQSIQTDQPALKLFIVHCMMRSVPTVSENEHWKKISNLMKEAISKNPTDPLISQTFCSILLRNQPFDTSQTIEEIQTILDDLYRAMKNPEAMYHLLAETGLRMWFKLFTLPEMQKKLSEEDEKNRKANLDETQQFLQGVVSGTFKKVIRNDFLMDALTKFPFANPAIEGVLSPFRKVLIGLEDLTYFKDVLPIMSAIATQVYLTGYFWAAESTELHDLEKKLFKLKALLKRGQAVSETGVPTEEFVFYLASVALYKPLNSDTIFQMGSDEESFRSVLKRLDLSSFDPLFRHLIDRTAFSRFDEERFADEFKVLGMVNENQFLSDQVAGQWFTKPGAVAQFSIEDYLRHLLPRSIPLSTTPPVEALVAGCRSGKEVAFLYTSIKGLRITVIDRSKKLLAQTKRLLQNVGISSGISFYVADLATVQLSDFPHAPKEGFDLISCIETLNHEQDPIKSINNLGNLLRTGGMLKGSVYTPKSFKFITTMRNEYYRSNHQLFQQGNNNHLEVKPDIAIKLDDIIQLKRSIDPMTMKNNMALSAEFISSPAVYNSDEFRRLFLHPRLADIDLITLNSACSVCSLKLSGFEFPGLPHKAYLDYLIFTDRKDETLSNPVSLHAFEQKFPGALVAPNETFRVFWAQKQ